MIKSKIYIRTDQGNALLNVPYGNISGDARRLLALIDGGTSVEAISNKVPFSVQVKLDEIFAQLLSGHLIAEKAATDSAATPEGSGHASQEQYQQTLQINPRPGEAVPLPNNAETESGRRIELERELAEVRSQLEATRARQKEVEAVCRRLEQQVAAFEQGKLRELAENMQQPPDKAEPGIELHDSLDNLNQLNQALLDRQLILDNTLKLRSFQMQLTGEHHQAAYDVKEEKGANSHPHYKKLRGLEFFKGFANTELLHFLNIAKWRRVRAGDTILNEGEVGMPFFIIVTGSVNVIRKSQLLASLGWGEFFGEFAYLSEHEPLRSAQVVAATDCELLVVEPMDVEFSSVQMRLHVVEALLRGQVKRALLSTQRIDNLLNHLDILSGHEPL
ncbi:MAG: cyclic nucleotide-binding domain-containing protein [Pseudomonadota bacterium]